MSDCELGLFVWRNQKFLPTLNLISASESRHLFKNDGCKLGIYVKWVKPMLGVTFQDSQGFIKSRDSAQFSAEADPFRTPGWADPQEQLHCV